MTGAGERRIHARAARWLSPVLATVVLAACCSEDSPLIQQQRAAKTAAAEAATRTTTARVPGGQWMEFEVQAPEGVALKPEVVQASCSAGANATVRITWSVPGVGFVRVSAGDASGFKVWTEGGGEGTGTTGDWVRDGTTFRFEDPASGLVLGHVRAIGLPCTGGAR